MKAGPQRAAVAASAVALLGGGGAALATTQGSKAGSPGTERQAFLNDVAGRLGVDVSKLREAIKGALGDRIDAAVAAGRISQAQADELKSRIESGDLVPFLGGGPGLFGGPGLPFGLRHGLIGGALSAAAGYLGASASDLANELQAGKSLADVAKEKGKSVDGLEQALLDAATEHLDRAVAAGRLTADQEKQVLAGLKSRIGALVQRSWRGPALLLPRLRLGDGPPSVFV